MMKMGLKVAIDFHNHEVNEDLLMLSLPLFGGVAYQYQIVGILSNALRYSNYLSDSPSFIPNCTRSAGKRKESVA
jgi:hypothetical protein